jgi:hypothetical protein
MGHDLLVGGAGYVMARWVLKRSGVTSAESSYGT